MVSVKFYLFLAFVAGPRMISGNWVSDPKYTPLYHIAADGYGDMGSRFIDLNGDGRMDQVYHRYISPGKFERGAHMNVPGYGFVCSPQYAPPFHIAADGYKDLGVRFMDLNGDGKTDMLYYRMINGILQQKGAYLNDGHGWSYAPQYIPLTPIAEDGVDDLGVRFIDLNGDGKMDMVFHRYMSGNKLTVKKGAYLNNGNGWTLAKHFTPPYQIASDGLADMGVRFVDLNGDGLMDMVYHRYINKKKQEKGAYLNDGYKWVWASQYTPPHHIAADGHKDLGVRFVDLNGDGKMDMVYHRYISPTEIQKGAYMNTGKGWVAALDYTPPFHIAADGYKDLGARFVDVNGDGLVDFVYHRMLTNGDHQKGAYINTGFGWKYAMKYIPPYHIAADGIGDLGARFVDLNGDGAMDLAYHRLMKSNVAHKGAYMSCGDVFEPYCKARSHFCDRCAVVKGMCRMTCKTCPK